MKGEYFYKAIQCFINEVYDSRYDFYNIISFPSSTVLLHAKSDWQLQPTIIIYNKHSAQPVELITNAARVCSFGAKPIQIVWIALAKVNIETIKKNLLNAASGDWIIVEDCHLISSKNSLEFIKVLFEEVLNDEQKDSLKIWITYEMQREEIHIPHWLFPLFKASFRIFIDDLPYMKDKMNFNYLQTSGPILSKQEYKTIEHSENPIDKNILTCIHDFENHDGGVELVEQTLFKWKLLSKVQL